MSDEKKMSAEEMQSALDTGDSMFNPVAVVRFTRGGDGEFYQIVPQSDGSFAYAPAPPNQNYTELQDGTFVVMADAQEALRQRKADSHKNYFKTLSENPDPREARRAMKRQDVLTKQLQQLQIDQAIAPTGPNVEFIKDEQFMDLSAMYRQAVVAGQAKQCEFQPFSAYMNKLVTSSGKSIRPIFAGEVGMKGSTILCLEPGYGKGQSAAVPGKKGE